MERGKQNQEEREEEKANNSSVSFSALRKDVVNVVDIMERLKSEENQIALEDGVIELLKFRLALICAHFLLSYSDLDQFENVMTSLREQLKDVFQSILVTVDNKYNMPQVLGSLLDNIDDCISSCPHSTSMTEEELDFLLLNLHYLSKYAEQMFPLSTQLVMLQNMCGNMEDFNGLIVNGCIEQDIVKYVLPLFQLMAQRVGFFLWVFHIESGLSDSDSGDEDSHLSKLNYLLLKIVPVEFELMHIGYTNLKSSTSAEVGRFIKQLLETFPDILREYLIHLQEYMVTIINPSISGARDIHIMMEFLLIILTDINESWDYSTKKFWFPKLDCLTELEELTVRFAYTRGFSPATNRPGNFNFPLSLKKLRLYDFRLTSDSLSTIARLPNLEVLPLYRTIIQGGEWNMGEEDTFENLKCLILNKVTLAKWEVGEESFPVLEKLELQRYCKLEEIPPSFRDIGSLKIIKLVECPQLEDSVMKIKEYAKDMRGGDEL